MWKWRILPVKIWKLLKARTLFYNYQYVVNKNSCSHKFSSKWKISAKFLIQLLEESLKPNTYFIISRHLRSEVAVLCFRKLFEPYFKATYLMFFVGCHSIKFAQQYKTTFFVRIKFIRPKIKIHCFEDRRVSWILHT